MKTQKEGTALKEKILTSRSKDTCAREGNIMFVKVSSRGAFIGEFTLWVALEGKSSVEILEIGIPSQI